MGHKSEGPCAPLGSGTGSGEADYKKEGAGTDADPGKIRTQPEKKVKSRSTAAVAKRLLVARQKRLAEKQILLAEPESQAASVIRLRRLHRAMSQGMKRAARKRNLSSTKAVGRPRLAASSSNQTPVADRTSWKFEDRVAALIECPDEIFRVLPTVYGASDSTPCTFEALNRLRPRQWFTDETINYYFAALGQQAQDPADIAIVNSYFFDKLETAGADSEEVRRYGRPASEKTSHRPGLLRGKILIVPIHWQGNHWVLSPYTHTRRR